MFKSARWRGDKNKIKVDFKLLFSATQVSQLSADSLTISVASGDLSKPSLKSEKAPVRDGSCHWENPVYLIVKFDRDSKSGKINAKIIKILVSTGLTKAGVLGEVFIDFSEYAEATKPSNLSLPLKNSNSSAILHVFLQRLQQNGNQREVEECEDKIAFRDLNTKSYLSNVNGDVNARINRTNDESMDRSSRNVKLNGDRRESSGSDITLSSSESSSGFDTPHEVESRSNKFDQNPPCLLVLQKSSEIASSKNNEEHQKEEWEWRLSNSAGNILPKESPEKETFEIERLKAELAVFVRRDDVSEMELQTLRKHIVKESKKGQDLLREIVSLKKERDLLKLECEKLKAFQLRVSDTNAKNSLQVDGGGDLQKILEEMRREINYEKDLNANLRIQLQKTQESNNELILAVQDLEHMLEKINTENVDELSKFAFSKIKAEEDEEQKALEDLVKGHINGSETFALEQKLMDLCGEIEIYRKDKDELEMQMEQIALDYEIMKQENHKLSYRLEQSQIQEQLKLQYECPSSLDTIQELEMHIVSLENELKQQSIDFSDSLTTIKELESHIIILEEELKIRIDGFEADIEALTFAKVEQEKQTIRAEEALRKTMRKNANTAEKLQEEFRRLSMQMISMFEANEKAALKALSEASDLRQQRRELEELLEKANEELQSLRDAYEEKIAELFRQLESNKTQFARMSEELDTKSKQVDCQRKHEEEVCRSLSMEIQTHKHAIKCMRIENDKLIKQEEYLRVQFGQMEKSVKETEKLIQEGNENRNELVITIALVKKEAENSMKELKMMSQKKREKVIELILLQSEFETLKLHCNDLKQSSAEDEMEMEKPRKHVVQLKSEPKKEEALLSVEKRQGNSNGHEVTSHGNNTSQKTDNYAMVNQVSKEFASPRGSIELLEEDTELRENPLEASTNSFLDERDVHNKFKELASRAKELDGVSVIGKKRFFQTLANGRIETTSDVIVPAETRRDECLTSDEFSAEKKRHKISNKGEIEVASERERKIDSTLDDQLTTEVGVFIRRMESMESELKEMQERYSEISLKFAEVEGERQKLVMTLRNLKNSKKRL